MKRFFICLITLSSILFAQKIKIAIDPSIPPLEYIKNNEYAGTSVDIIKYLSKKKNFEYEFVYTAYRDFLPSIEKGDTDLIMVMTINDKRMDKLDFTVPYYWSYYMFIKDSSKDFDENTDLSEKRICVVHSGTTAHKKAQSISKKVIVYDRIGQLVLGLKFDKCDAGIVDSTLGSTILDATKFADKMSGKDLEELKMAYDLGSTSKIQEFKRLEKEGNKGTGAAVKKGANREIFELINNGIEEMIEDGTMKKILGDNGLI